MTIKITKQLATVEDLAIGTGTVIQERNGVPLTLTKIDFVPKSEVVIRVTSIAAMEAYSAPVGYVFSLNAGGRSGTFDVIAGDFSTELAADTLNGIYVGLADDPSAATKVAKRRKTDVALPSWFGIIGDGVTIETNAYQTFLNRAGKLYVPKAVNILIDDEVSLPSNTLLKIDGQVTQKNHGYNTHVIDNKSNSAIYGKGLIKGHAVFPGKGTGGGEKRLTLDAFGRWPKSKGSTDNGLGSFGGGFLGNGGSGVLILNGCQNIAVDIETSGHNMSGVTVGDVYDLNKNEAYSKNIYIKGSHNDNYNAGIGYHAVDGILIAPGTICENNGHPDAVSADDEINPGYGITSQLVGNSGTAAKNANVFGTLTGNKRKGFDMHSGTFTVFDVVCSDSLVDGVALGGSSGDRGNVKGKCLIKNCGTASGASVDAKTGLSIEGGYNDCQIEAKIYESGLAYSYSVYGVDNVTLSVELESNISSRPFYANQVTYFKASGKIKGAFANSGLYNVVTGQINNLDMSEAVIDSGNLRCLSMTGACVVDILSGNTWNTPQFNTNNSGIFFPSSTEAYLTYNGTSIPDLVVVTGAKFLSSTPVGSSGAGAAIVGLDGSQNLETTLSSSLCFITPMTALVANIVYVAAISTEESGAAKIIISPRNSSDEVIATNTANISAVSLGVLIRWNFQL